MSFILGIREGNIAHIYASYISLSKSSAKITHILWKGAVGMGDGSNYQTSHSRNNEKRDVTEKRNSTTEKSTIKVGDSHSHQNSSKIGDNLNLKTPASEISTLELSQNQNLNLLKKIKQNENKTNKMNKQKRKEKKKDQKSAQFLKKLNVSSIEATCAKVNNDL